MNTSCTNAPAPKKLETAVKKIKESEDRSRNLMIYGSSEENNENLKDKVADIFTHIEGKPLFSIPSRVGNSDRGSVRPVKVSLTSASMVSASMCSQNLANFVNRKYIAQYISVLTGRRRSGLRGEH